MLPKSGVCFGYLFFKWVNDILDMVSYNRNKFMLSVIIVSKEMMKTSVFDLGKPSPKVTDRWRGAYANAVIPELVRIMIT